MEDAVCCWLKFKNAFDKGQCCIVRLYEGPNFWVGPVNTRMCVCVCVISKTHDRNLQPLL